MEDEPLELENEEDNLEPQEEPEEVPEEPPKEEPEPVVFTPTWDFREPPARPPQQQPQQQQYQPQQPQYQPPQFQQPQNIGYPNPEDLLNDLSKLDPVIQDRAQRVAAGFVAPVVNQLVEMQNQLAKQQEREARFRERELTSEAMAAQEAVNKHCREVISKDPAAGNAAVQAKLNEALNQSFMSALGRAYYEEDYGALRQLHNPLFYKAALMIAKESVGYVDGAAPAPITMKGAADSPSRTKQAQGNYEEIDDSTMEYLRRTGKSPDEYLKQLKIRKEWGTDYDS